MPDGTVRTVEDLRSVYSEPGEVAVKKAIPRLDKHCKAFIAASPFLVIGSSAVGDGPADVSPRGDPPGFVAILDDETLLLPDRLGNNRVDTMENITGGNPNVALIFFVPGMNETLRVNGKAAITLDEALLAPLAIDGKPPKSGLIIKVEQAYLHCAKALIRSKLWDPSIQIERSAFPSLGRMIADQVKGVDGEQAERRIEDAYKHRLY